MLEQLGGGLYIGGARTCCAGVAVDTSPAPRTRVLAHGLREGDELLMQGSRRRGRARGQEEKEPNAIKASVGYSSPVGARRRELTGGADGGVEGSRRTVAMRASCGT